jgi:Amino acid permease
MFSSSCIEVFLGFECTPAYIEDIRPDAYGLVLRNLLCGALVLNAPLMLLVYAQLPEPIILSGANVLSLLSERVGGRWLRMIIVVDAMLVLSGGVLTGLFTVCGLVERLAQCVFCVVNAETSRVNGIPLQR